MKPKLRQSSLTALATLLTAVVLMPGCQYNPLRTDTTQEHISEALKEGIEAQPKAPAVPPAVANALLPRIEPRTKPLVRKEPRFEISVVESDAGQFFRSLVDGTPHNMVIHPEVQGAITLDLKNVTVAEVLAITRDVYGYEFRRTGYGFEVLPARLRSRIFQVDFLNMLRTGSSQTRVSSGQLSQTDTGTSSTNSTTTTTSRDTTVSGTEINTLQPETTFWSELEAAIHAILGDAPGRSAVVNPQSGVVVVRAMPHELREVEQFLNATQAIARRQVILEAKILEVELNDGYRQGINWGALVNVDNHPITFGHVGGGSIIDPNTRLDIDNAASLNRGVTGNLNPSALVPIIGTAASGFGGIFSIALALGDFAAFIELLETQGTVHVLSSPRIATLNNQKAVIKVGSDEFFVTHVSSTTVTGTTTTTTPSVELTPFFSGIALDVTPQISAAGDVLLHVHPAISQVVDQTKDITVGGVAQSLPLALSTVRESDTIVQAANGQVIVIGGLMQDRSGDEAAKTPGLADASLIGPLFRQSRKSTRKSELVILLRPIVVNSGQQWASAMEGSLNRINAINQANVPEVHR